MEDEEEEDNLQPHPLASVSAINPDEIPEVPRNRFLDRGYQNRITNEEAERGRSGSMQGGKSRSKNSQFYTRSGRKVKGRGSLVSVFQIPFSSQNFHLLSFQRYRTPSRSRSRSRSQTPPHWRQAQRRTISFERYQVNYLNP